MKWIEVKNDFREKQGNIKAHNTEITFSVESLKCKWLTFENKEVTQLRFKQYENNPCSLKQNKE